MQHPCQGQIIGVAVDRTGQFHGYLATPPHDRDADQDHEERLGPMQPPEFVREQLPRPQMQLRHGKAAAK